MRDAGPSGAVVGGPPARRHVKTLSVSFGRLYALCLLATLVLIPVASRAQSIPPQASIVLVDGVWADASIFDVMTRQLQRRP